VTSPLGHKEFPKGKRHHQETTKETALGELYEKTGISVDDIEFLPDIFLD